MTSMLTSKMVSDDLKIDLKNGLKWPQIPSKDSSKLTSKMALHDLKIGLKLPLK